MEKVDSCRNCYEHIRYGCGGRGNWESDKKAECWRPDYDALKQDLADTQQALKFHQLAIDDLKGQMAIESGALKEACQVIVEFQQRLNDKYLDSDQIEKSRSDWEKFLKSRQYHQKSEVKP